MSNLSITKENLEKIYQKLENISRVHLESLDHAHELVQKIVRYALEDDWEEVMNASKALTYEATTIFLYDVYSDLVYDIDGEIDENISRTFNEVDEDEFDDEF